MQIDGKPVAIPPPHDEIAAGLAFVPEDRKAQGLVLASRSPTTCPPLGR